MSIPTGIEGLLVNAAYDRGVEALSRFRNGISSVLFSEPDKVHEEFLSNLEKSIESRAKKSENTDLFEIILPRNWRLIKANVTILDDSAPVESSDIIFRKEQIVSNTVQSIANIAGLNIEDNPELRAEITKAVEEAYAETFSYLRSKAAEKNVPEELADIELDIANTLDEIQKEFETSEQDVPWSDAFELYRVEDYSEEKIRGLLADLLGVDLSLPAIKRDCIDEIRDDRQLLIKGNPGLGKSSLLLSLVMEKVSTEEITEILVPNHNHITAEEANYLSKLDISGDVLLVWDDIHEVFYFNKSSNVFAKAVRSIEEARDDKESVASVIATLRTNGAEEIDDYKKPGTIWTDLTEWKLPELREDEVWEFIEEYLQYYDIPADQETKLNLALKVISAEPSPFFVRSMVLRIADEGEINREVLEGLPEDALQLWEEQYRSFIVDKPARKHILWSLKILRELRVSYYSSLVKGIYLEVFERDKEDWFENIGYLEEEGWIKNTVADTTNTELMISNDTQIDSISIGDMDSLVEAYIEEISTFLLDSIQKYIPPFCQWVEPILQQNLALYYLILDYEKDSAQIEEHFQRAINADFQMAEPYANYASFLARGEDDRSEKAEEYYAEAVELQPDSFIIRWGYADQLTKANKLDESLTQYSIAEEIEQGTPEFYERYGTTLVDAEMFNEARNKFEEAIKLGSTNELPYLGYIYTRSILGEELPNWFEDRLEDVDLGIATTTMRAALAFQNGNESKADSLIDEIEESDSDHFLVDAILANKAVIEEDRVKAREHFERSIENSPTDTPSLGYGFFLSQSGEIDDLEKAAKHLRASIEFPKQDVEFIRRYGEVLLRLSGEKRESEEEREKYLEEAKQAYETILERGDENTQDRFHYGQILYHLGSTRESEVQSFESFKQAVKERDRNMMQLSFELLLAVCQNEEAEGDAEYWYEESQSYIGENLDSNLNQWKAILDEKFEEFRNR